MADKSTSTGNNVIDDDYTNLCILCFGEGDALRFCQAESCRNSFHETCSDMSRSDEQVKDKDVILCPKCVASPRGCVFCAKPCDELQCDKRNCKSMLHQECVETHRQFISSQIPLLQTPKKNKARRNSVLNKNFCSRHFCSTCSRPMQNLSHHCYRCNRVFHKHCTPPSSTFLQQGLLCDHHNVPLTSAALEAPHNVPFFSRVFEYQKLPFEVPLSFQEFDPSEMDEEIKEKRKIFTESCRSTEAQKNYLHLPASKSFSKFRKISQNIYKLASAVTVDPDDIQSCGCDPSGDCSSGCLNRITFTECSPKLCPCKERCTNQRFQNKESAPLRVVQTSNRGNGCISTKDLKPGDLIIEYVGEVIDKEEYSRRITEICERQERNFYFLSINSQRIIDAEHKGGVGRFINHSCNPNCQTQRWTAGNQVRVGIFAIEDIPAGVELTYNYHMLGFWSESAHPCHCGAKNCSGDLSGRPSRKQRLEKASKQNSLKRSKSSSTPKSTKKARRKSKPTLNPVAAVAEEILREIVEEACESPGRQCIPAKAPNDVSAEIVEEACESPGQQCIPAKALNDVSASTSEKCSSEITHESDEGIPGETSTNLD